MTTPSVGRTWYMRLTRGVMNGAVEVGTHHIDTGTQVWYTAAWDAPLDPMTMQDLCDELYVALMRFMESLDRL